MNDLKIMIEDAKSKPSWELNNAILNLQSNLYNLRKGRGLTQRELSDSILVTHAHIVRHESWAQMPSMNSLAKYAHFYGISIAMLLDKPENLRKPTIHFVSTSTKATALIRKFEFNL